MTRIDAHQHFWRYDPAAFAWIDPAGPLAQDRLPGDLRSLLDAAGIDAAIAVQARQDDAETDWLLSLAAEHRWIAGVVGWVDLQADDVASRIARIAADPRLVGLRHIVQDEPDPDFLARPGFVRGVRAAIAAGLAYDILVFAHQADRVPAFLDAVGQGRFVLDHGAKPAIATGGWQPWADAIRRIAAYPGVWCKLSGLVTEADHAAWRPADIERYMDHLLDCFGPDRLIYGSDWPVCTLAGSYAQVHGLAVDHVARHCPAHVDAIFGDNACAAYRLPGKDAE